MSKRMVWEPLGDGQITSFLHIENDGSQVAVFAGDDYADWYATEDLPDNIRLCRQVESDAVSVPIGVREAIAVCANYGMPVGVTYWQYNGARDKVIAWLDEQKAGE